MALTLSRALHAGADAAAERVGDPPRGGGMRGRLLHRPRSRKTQTRAFNQPGKTWEGAVGGVVAALAMAALAHFWFFRELPLKYMLPLAAIMTLVGIFGDLAESALKRGAGAKDAANILPGHGGILDRLDSLLFNAPLIYYFARFYFQS